MAATVGAPTSKVKANVGWEMVFPITFSGNYSTGGDAADFGPYNPILRQPRDVTIKGKAGYTYSYDYVNKKILVYIGTGAHTHTENTAGAYTQNATTGAINSAATEAERELAAGAYPAGITGDSVTAYVVF